MEEREVVLDNGTVVYCQGVNQLAIGAIAAQCPGCRMPSPPIEEIPGKAGVTRAQARPGTPQYAEWEAARDQVLEMRRRVEDDAVYYVGITGWKLPGETKKHRNVPKGWQFPDRLAELGVTSYESMLGEAGRRWDYIIFELMGSTLDQNKVLRGIYNFQDNAEPLEEEEVEAAAEKFPGDEA